MEFSYKSFQVTIQMTPFKALCGRKCHSLVYWNDFMEVATLDPNMLVQRLKMVTHLREDEDNSGVTKILI